MKYVYDERSSVAEAFSCKPMLQDTRSTSRNEGEHSAAKYDGFVTNQSTLEDMSRHEMQRVASRAKNRMVERTGKMRKTHKNALSHNLDHDAEILNEVTHYVFKRMENNIEEARNYTVELVPDGRIKVTRKPGTVESYSFSKDLPVEVNRKEKTRYVTLVQDENGDTRLACECRVFLNRNFPCCHQIAINGGNFGKRDIHFRYLKVFLDGQLDHLLLPRTLSDYSSLGPLLHHSNVLNIVEPVVHAISLEKYDHKYGTVHDSDTGVVTALTSNHAIVTKEVMANTDNDDSDDDLSVDISNSSHNAGSSSMERRNEQKRLYLLNLAQSVIMNMDMGDCERHVNNITSKGE